MAYVCRGALAEDKQSHAYHSHQVCQQDVRSVQLRRYAYDTVALVKETSKSGRVLGWPFVPSAWESALRTLWQVADMIYTYARQQLVRSPPANATGLLIGTAIPPSTCCQGSEVREVRVKVEQAEWDETRDDT